MTGDSVVRRLEIEDSSIIVALPDAIYGTIYGCGGAQVFLETRL